MTIKTILPAIIGLACIGSVFAFTSITHANPLAFATTVQTATATTSPTYLVPGLATSTLVYDSYAVRPTTADKASLAVQAIGSSTSAVYNVSFEYSNGAPGLDCVGAPTSCDWYKDNLMTPVTSTTSQAYSINQPISYSWTFASSTQGGAAAVDNRSLKMLSIPTPTRYVRAIFSIIGANGSVWGQIVPAKQNN